MVTSSLTDAKRRLLERLKRSGAMKASALAAALGLTDVAIRQHLQALEEKGLVESASLPPEGRGRPSVAWSLTDLAAGLFPDRHADLTVDLLRSLRKALGEEGVLRIVEVRAKDQVNLYKTMIPAGASLKKKVQLLADQRTAEGYMAEVVCEKPGRYLLIEHHCPICDAAKTCQGLCKSELEVFRKVLGRKVSIERIEHLLEGGERCVYRIEAG